MLSGLKTIEEVDGYLSEVDSACLGENPSSERTVNVSRGKGNNWRGRQNDANRLVPNLNPQSGRVVTNNNNAAACVIIENAEELLEVASVPTQKFAIRPIICIQVEETETDALVNSGRQVTCILQFSKKNCVSEERSLKTEAFGCRSQVIKEQVYHGFQVENVEFSFVYVVVPK